MVLVVHPVWLLPRDADQLRFGLDQAHVLGPRAAGSACPIGRRGAVVSHERRFMRAPPAVSVVVGAGARVIWMSPVTVLARISTSGPSPAGASEETSSSELVSPLTVVAVEEDLRAAADADRDVARDGVGGDVAAHDGAVVLVAADGVDVDVVVGLADRHVARRGCAR